MFTKSNNQTLAQLPNFILLMTKNIWNETYMHQLLSSSKLHFDLNFWRFGKVIDVYVELTSCCYWWWSFNKHWFESFHSVFNSLQIHQLHTIYWEATKIFCLCNLSSKHLEHKSKIKFHFYIESTIQNVWFCANYLFFCNFDKGTKGMELLLCNSI
jgi:hypothetical protein